MGKATVVAHPNIAFVKYWGRSNDALNLPANPSLSMNLAELKTTTTVEFDPAIDSDQVVINNKKVTGRTLSRVVEHLGRVRIMAATTVKARVASENNFPAGTGLASSASGFAALTLAASVAAGLQLSVVELSRLSRLGSGSATRSVPGGYVLWEGNDDHTSYASQIAPPEHWDLRDVIAIISQEHKLVDSHSGHSLARTSPFHGARLDTVAEKISQATEAIQNRNLAQLGAVMEEDALAMHAVMLTSRPALLYWEPTTIGIIRAITDWRELGLQAYFTMDAGPNVHCICEGQHEAKLKYLLANFPGVEGVMTSGPGRGAHLVPESDLLS